MKQKTLTTLEKQATKDLIDEIRELKEELIDEIDPERRHYLKANLFENLDRVFEQTGDEKLVERLVA